MINKVMLVGRVGKDPELKYIPSGDPVCNFNIATSKTWKDKQGDKQEKTEWHKIVVWGKLAEICAEYVKKGSLVYIEGEITTRSWDDKDGVKRYSTEIVASEMKMLGGKKESSGSNATDSNLDDCPF